MRWDNWQRVCVIYRDVGDVRNGANAIYSGASEIATGNNDLSSRTEQQAASLEELASRLTEAVAVFLIQQHHRETKNRDTSCTA